MMFQVSEVGCDVVDAHRVGGLQAWNLKPRAPRSTSPRASRAASCGRRPPGRSAVAASRRSSARRREDLARDGVLLLVGVALGVDVHVDRDELLEVHP
jgi:hypothetical protein